VPILLDGAEFGVLSIRFSFLCFARCDELIKEINARLENLILSLMQNFMGLNFWDIFVKN
jgi:hypothetical protein